MAHVFEEHGYAHIAPDGPMTGTTGEARANHAGFAGKSVGR